MSTTVISFKYEADATAFLRTTQKVEQSVASLGGAAKVGAVFGAAFAVAERAVGMATDALGGGVRAIAEYSSRLQSSKVAWTQFLGSGENAEALMLRMQQIAAKSPFSFEDVERGTQRLVAMGFTLKETESVMQDAITVSSGFGKGVAGVDSLTIALGQMNGSGHVYAQDMNQLIAVGVPAWQILADATGQSVAQTRKQAEQGKITSDVMLAAFHAWAGSKFGDVVAQQSRTATGALSTIRDNLLATGARAFAPAMEGFTALANRIADFTASPAFGIWASKVAAVLAVVIQNVAALAGFFASGLGAVLTVVTGVGQAIYDALSWINPFATHSPSLVSQVEDGVAVIMQAYARLPGIGGPLGAAADAVRAFAAVASGGMADYEAAQDQATAQTLAIFGADVPAAYLAAKAAIGQLQQSLIPLQAAITAQEGVVASWEQAVKSTQGTLDTEKAKLAALEQQLGSLQAAYDNAKKRVDDFARAPLAGTKALEDQIFAVEQQALGVQLALAEWKVSPATLASIKSAQDAVAAQQGVVDDWSARVAASEQAVKRQESAVAAAEQAQIAYANAVKAAQGAIDAQKERIAAANATLGAQKDALAAAQKQLAEYGKAQLSGTQAFQDQLFALDMEVAAVQKRLIDLKLDPGLNAQIASTEAAIVGQTAAIADAERGMKAYDQAVGSAKAALTQQQATLAEGRAAVDAIASSLKRAQDAIKTFASTAITGTKAFDDELFALDQRALAVQKRLIDLKLDPTLNAQIVAAQAAIDAETDSIADAERALKGYDAAVIAAKSGLAEQQAALADNRATVDELSRSLKKAQDAIRGFAGTDISGTKGFEDQLFALDQQAAAVKLQMNTLLLGGATKKDSALTALRDQLDAINLQAENVNLQKQLQLDPLRKQIKDLASTTKELSFDDIVNGIKAAQGQEGALSKSLASANSVYAAQQAVVDGAQQALAVATAARDKEKAAIDASKDALAGLNGQLAALKATQAPKEMTDQLAALQDRATQVKLAERLQLEPLKRQIADLVNTTKELGFADIVNGIVAAQGEESDLTKRLVAANGAYAAQQAAVAGAQQALDGATAARDREKASIDASKDALAGLNSQLAALKAVQSPKELTDQLANLQDRATQVKLAERLELEPLRRQLAALLNPIKELSFSEIAGGIASTRQTIAGLEQQVASSTTAWEREKAALVPLEAALKDAERARDDHAKVIDREKATLAGLQGALAENRAGYAGAKDELERYNAALKAAQTAPKELTDALQALQDQADLLKLSERVQFDPLRKQIEDLAHPVKELTFAEITNGIRAAQAEMAAIDPQIAAVTAQIAAQKTVVEGATAAHDAATARLAAERDTLDTLKKRYSDITAQVQAWEQSLTRVTSAASGATKAAEAASGPVGEKKATNDINLDDQKNQLAQMSEQYNKTKKEIEDRVNLWKDRLTAAYGYVRERIVEVRDSVVSVLGPAFDWFDKNVTPVVERFAGFVRDNFPAIATTLAIVAAGFSAFSIISTVVGWVTSAIAVWGVLSVAIEGVGGIVAALVIVLGGPLTLAIAAVVGIVTLLGVAWANNWGDIQGKVAAVWAWLQPVLAALGARLSQFWTDILPQLSAAWESVSTKVVAAATWLWTQAQAIFGAVAGFLIAHGDQILAVLGGAWALIKNTINTYLGVISNLVRGVLALISGDWDGAWAYIQNAARIAWTGIVAFFGSAGGLLVQALGAIWGLIQRAASAAWDAIGSAVGGKFSDLGTAIQGKLDDIQGWWRDRWNAVASFVSGIWDGIVSGVTGALLALYNAVTGKVADLRAWLNDRWNDIKQTASDIWNSMVGQIVQAVIGLGVTILKEIGQTQALILAIFVHIAQNGLDKFTDLYNWVTGKVGDLASWVTGKLGDLRDTLGRIWDAVYTKATDLWSSLWSAVTKTASDVRDDLTSRITTARDTLAGLWQNVYDTATQKWDGVRSWLAQTAQDMQAKITGPIDAAKGLLDTTWTNIYTKAIDTWNGVRQHLFNTGQDMLDRVASPITAARDTLNGVWQTIYDTAAGKWNDLKKLLWDTGQNMKDALLSPFNGAKDAIGGIVNAFGNGIINSLNGAGDRVRGFGNGVRSIINWIAERLGAGGIADQSPAFSLPGLATGTKNWGGGMAWVGEGPGGAGAELAYLPRGAQVMTHRESMALVRSGAVAPPQSGPALVPGFAGGLDALGGIFDVLKKGAGWLYDQAKGAVGLKDLALPGALGDIGGKLGGKVKDWALGSIDRMLKAATPKVAPGGRGVPGAGWGDPSPGLVDARIPGGRALSGLGSTIVAAAHAHGVPTSVFMGILEHESAYGSPNDGLTRYNNFTGLTGHGWTGQTGTTQGMARDFAIFDSRESGINAALDNLTTGLYRDRSLREVLSMWLTGGYNENTDPTHPQYTVADYLSHVRQVVEALGGNFNQDAIVVGTAAPISSAHPASPANNRPAGNAPVWDGWSPPLAQYSVSQEFGHTDFSEGAYGSGSHTGIDLVGPRGAQVMAAALGKVASAGDAGGYGNAVKIDHGGGIESIYGHLASISTSVSELLSRGDNLGIQGSSGYSTGDHVHFEIRKGGTAVNPRDYVGFADGGVITEPIVGRGVRSGRGYTFGEAGPEGVFNADQMAALSPGGKGRVTIHAPLTINVEGGDPEEIGRVVDRRIRRLVDNLNAGGA